MAAVVAMYRDESAALRQRLTELQQAVRASWSAMEAELRKLAGLNEQLAGHEPGGVELPTLRPPELGAEPVPSASADELRAQCDVAEREQERLARQLDMLRRARSVLAARVRGGGARLSLGPPPRAVPRSYLLGEWLGFSPMVLLFGGLMGLPIALGFASQSPWLALPVGVVALGGLGVLLVRARSRMGFLERCKEGTKVRVIGSAGGSSKYTNWPLAMARGWSVKHESYTGHGVATTLSFATDEGAEQTLTISGAPYEDGVVLYEPETGEAYCVSQLWCAPRPDIWGQWLPGLSLSLWVRVLIATAIFAIVLIVPLAATLAG